MSEAKINIVNSKYVFISSYVRKQLVTWIQNFFKENGPNCNAVVGISGGKDSTIVAALCVEALGKDRVIGVLMPNGVQSDIDYAVEVCEYLGITSYTINIEDAVNAITDSVKNTVMNWSRQSEINLPARIRMSTLYAVSQTVNGRVANTCNLSEDWVGYATRYGDAAGDFSPLSQLTVSEVKVIGNELGLPSKFVEKVPTDGLCGTTDEDNLGFTYKELDAYIRGYENPYWDPDFTIRKKIDDLHMKNRFKLEMMPHFPFNPIESTNEQL